VVSASQIPTRRVASIGNDDSKRSQNKAGCEVVIDGQRRSLYRYNRLAVFSVTMERKKGDENHATPRRKQPEDMKKKSV
jgi:hypothetical protein